MNKTTEISIIIPIYNEEENLKELYKRLFKVLLNLRKTYEMIFVDDGSTDKSFEILNELHKIDNNVKIIQFSRNFGHHIAITAGLDHCTGKLVVLMDGDLQDQPEEIPKLLNKLNKGYDIVYGIKKNRQDKLFKRITSKIFVFLIKKIIQEKIEINNTIFRIMKRKVVLELNKCRETNRYIIGLFGYVGFKQTGIEINHNKRFRGKTKYSLFKMLKLTFDAVFSFSILPLRMTTLIGISISLISFILGTYFILKKIIYSTAISGWSSLIVSIFFLGGIQLIMIGILGEYIGRNYIETKKRPLYSINEFIK